MCNFIMLDIFIFVFILGCIMDLEYVHMLGSRGDNVTIDVFILVLF